jgi:L-alanine-DL-glutamate epimerase-like enolase superfamily enzyme
MDCLGLFGKSPKGGWTNEIQPGDAVHALVIVKTDTGLMGVGSVFTDSRLAEAALGVPRPLVIGRRRSSRCVLPKTPPEQLLDGARRHTDARHSGIDIAMWDIFGQVTGQPIRTLLGSTYNRVKAYASILMEMPE